jgi:hypothetical protein
MGGEGKEGKGSNATTTAIVFLCYSFSPFCVVDPLGQRVFAYNVYCIWCFFCCLSLLICSFYFFLDPYLLFLDLLAQCGPVRGLPDFVARLPSAFSFLRCC